MGIRTAIRKGIRTCTSPLILHHLDSPNTTTVSPFLIFVADDDASIDAASAVDPDPDLDDPDLDLVPDDATAATTTGVGPDLNTELISSLTTVRHLWPRQT
jgi:hypothetical protein